MQGLAAQHHHYLPLEPDDPREIGRYPLAARLGAEEEIDFRYFSTGDDAALRTAGGQRAGAA
jgi:hypothetical protein